MQMNLEKLSSQNYSKLLLFILEQVAPHRHTYMYMHTHKMEPQNTCVYHAILLSFQPDSNTPWKNKKQTKNETKKNKTKNFHQKTTANYYSIWSS